MTSQHLCTLTYCKGLAVYLAEHVAEAKEKGVIVGFDGRHNSSRFAELAAATFLHKGLKVYLFEGVIPTPLVVSFFLSSSLFFRCLLTQVVGLRDNEQGLRCWFGNYCFA